MLRKIALIIGTLISINAQALDWDNQEYAERGQYSYTAEIKKDTNSFEYRCSVFKFDSDKFATMENINLDLNLKLEEDKLNFQNSYNVNIIFSNGQEFQKELILKPGLNGLDRFSLFLNPKDNKMDQDIISNLSNRSYVNVEIVDKNKKRMLYRFGLNGSMKSIVLAKEKCRTLYETFK